jgi:hypothetical protein
MGRTFSEIGQKRGGWGVFAGNSSYVIDGVGVERWLPDAFCTLLYTFCGVSARAGRTGRSKDKDGLAFVVSHPCLKNNGTARMGHPASLAASAIFRILSSMVFALRRITLIVRL